MLNAQSVTATRLNSRQLNVTQEQVDPNALDVVSKLKNAGFQALLVGGCVRDLLLGASPKDFDVATDATPEDVRRLFRRSRMVGRRFRIAHVRYGRDIIEVSTFRKSANLQEAGDRTSNPDGLILRDNVYGTIDEDAFRRDFTVNALYYDPHEEEILDFVGGIADLRKHRLRFIGEPRERLQEDPVRLLRAIRFQAKLGFILDAGIMDDADLTAARLMNIPSARLFDEFSKMFLSGYAMNVWKIIEPTPIRSALFPTTPPNNTLVELAMHSTDQRIAQGKPVTPGFLLAVLLWDDYQARISELAGDKKINEARLLAAHESLAGQRNVLAIPRRFSQFVNDVWQLQGRLEVRKPRQIVRTLNHPRFRAAYDFLLLRSEAELIEPSLADWWTEIQDVDITVREKMINELAPAPGKKRRRRRPRRPS